MSRRDYPTADRYEERQSDFYRKPRGERNYQELDVDIQESRYDGPARSRYDGPSRRAETVVKERDVEVDRRDRGPRQPDFLREDYGKSSNAGELVVREKREEDDYVSRAPTKRRSFESTRSRGPARTERVDKEEISFKERERGSGPRYSRNERVNFEEEEKTVYRERSRSRPPEGRGGRSEEKIDIRIREDERSDRRRTNFEETDIEEIRFRRGGGDRPPPRREEVEREEITIRERDREPYRPRESTREEIDINIRERDRESYRPRESKREEIDISIRENDRGPYRPRETTREEIDIDIKEKERGPRRGRETEEEIDIDITRDRSAPRQRSMSRGALVRKDREEWIVRRRRTPSPEPPPVRDYEKEEIIIRRKERTPSPEPPPREPTPEPLPPPVEPIYRPPIIQEVITHHRHIDHGVERARSPTPPPPPSPPSPPKEDQLEVSIRRTGTRNGKAFEEDITFETDRKEGRNEDRREVVREEDTRESFREVDIDRTRSVSNVRRRYDDDVSNEADYYNRKAASRGYPGEGWNGATRDWGLVDIPPGTERVRMDGMGGGRQEITWDRYNGERRGHFYTGDRVYESEYGNGFQPPGPPLPPPERTRETRFTETRINEETRSGKTRDRTWTEVTKDLVLEEAIKEQGYEYEESDGYFYVMEYLRYEDVLRLVEITEDIRRERRDRLREIQWEREEIDRAPKMLPPPPPPVPAPPRRGYDERIYEREYDYHRDGRRYR